IEVRVCVVVTTDGVEQKTKIILDACQITRISSLFEVETGGSVFHEGAIDVGLEVVNICHTTKGKSEAVVKCAVQVMVAALLKQFCRFVVDANRFAQPSRIDLDDSRAYQNRRTQVDILGADHAQRLRQRYSGFVKSTFAPVTDREVCTRFRDP